MLPEFSIYGFGLQLIQIATRRAENRAPLETLSESGLKPNSFDFALGEPLFRPIVKFSGTRALMCRHLLSVFEPAAIGEIGGYPRGSKRVAADFLGDAGRRGALPDHAPGVGLSHGLF